MCVWGGGEREGGRERMGEGLKQAAFTYSLMCGREGGRVECEKRKQEKELLERTMAWNG